MANYLVTQGKVIASQVGVNKGIAAQSSKIVDRYAPDVTYQYTVEGKDYQNNRFWQESIHINQLEKIEALVAQYPIGKTIPVYYNPENPSDSFLQDLSAGNSAPGCLSRLKGLIFGG